LQGNVLANYRNTAAGDVAVAAAVGRFRLFGFVRRSENATALLDGSLLIYRYKWNASGIIPWLFTTRRAIVGGTRRDGAKLSPFALSPPVEAIIKSAASERDRYDGTAGPRLSKPPGNYRHFKEIQILSPYLTLL